MPKHQYPKERKPTGPRPMAGRKPKLNNGRRVSLWLSQEQIDWLESQGDKSEIIRQLINKERTINNVGKL